MSNKVICPVCKAEVPSAKFCEECGTLLIPKEETAPKEQKPQMPGLYGMNNAVNMNKPIPKAEEPENCTFYAEYCSKTLATAGGDGRDELVLYKNEKTGEFEIHSFRAYQYMDAEEHHSWKADSDSLNRVLAFVEETKIESLIGTGRGGLCGGEQIIKYVKDGKVTRTTTSDLPMEHYELFRRFQTLLNELKKEVIC